MSERMLSVLAAVLIAGCFDPLVGAECAPAYEQCGGSCVDLTSDIDNCGACGLRCEGSCVEGQCLSSGGDDVSPEEPITGTGSGGLGDPFTCNPGYLACRTGCIDPLSDPTSCGACGRVCASGICEAGTCIGDPSGHLFVIGHDYRTANLAIRRLLGNAVFASPGLPVRVALYEGSARPASLTGIDAAIDRVAAELGRRWVKQPITAGDIAVLDDSHVLVVAPQASGGDHELIDLGASWAPALGDFLADGKIAIVLDGPAGHAGTWQIAAGAGLIELDGRYEVAGGEVELVAPADLAARGVPSVYAAATSTVRFAGSDGSASWTIAAAGDQPVVLHQPF